MAPFRPFRYTIGILALGMLMVGVACVLPQDPYQRWQLLDGTIHRNARWIYERCNFDPTPIDVVFLGPSRMERAVNAPRLERELAAAGEPAHVVNFSLPEAGRNIHAVILDEVMRTKHPKLIVIGITEKPSRYGHSAFKYIAPASDILNPGYVGDVNYFSDFIYLPYRQLTLFIADLFPSISGLTKHFDRSEYRGESVDTTGDIWLPGGKIINGETPATAKELARGVRKLEKDAHPPILGPALADVEFGDERHNIRRMVDLAHAKGAKVMFLAIPYYTGPSAIQERKFYEQFGPVLSAAALSRHAELYVDYGHLTRGGGEILTDRLLRPVLDALHNAPVTDLGEMGTPANGQ